MAVQSWSGLRKVLRTKFVDSIQKSLDVHFTRYESKGAKGQHSERNSRFWITYSGDEIYSVSAHQYYARLRIAGIESELAELDPNIVVSGGPEYPEDLQRCGVLHGIYGPWDAVDALREYCELSIQEAQQSTNPFIRGFALVDSRTGKRTLQRLTPAEDDHELVQVLYGLRCG